MPIPRRDDFPDEMNQALQRVDYVTEWSRNYQPVLPAAETPPELVRAAIDLDAQLAAHEGLPEALAIEEALREHITAALAGSITEPVTVPRDRQLEHEMRLRDYPDLTIARGHFQTLLESAEPHKSRDGDWLHELATRKKAIAKRHSIDLDLTRDEWAEL